MTNAAFFIDLKGWPCLVAGGNEPALVQTKQLLKAGAMISCWSAEFVPGFTGIDRGFQEQLSLIRGELERDMLRHMLKSQLAPRFVFISTDDEDKNHDLYEICEEYFVPASIIGFPSRLEQGCIIDRSVLKVAVSASMAPEIEERIVKRMEREISQDWHEGSVEFAKLRYSQEMRNMHPTIRENHLAELASDLMECHGRFAAAKIKNERKQGKKI